MLVLNVNSFNDKLNDSSDEDSGSFDTEFETSVTIIVGFSKHAFEMYPTLRRNATVPFCKQKYTRHRRKKESLMSAPMDKVFCSSQNQIEQLSNSVPTLLIYWLKVDIDLVKPDTESRDNGASEVKTSPEVFVRYCTVILHCVVPYRERSVVLLTNSTVNDA